jgi:hypothetical protein
LFLRIGTTTFTVIILKLSIMIRELKIEADHREEERQKLIIAGYISATALYSKNPNELWDLSINPHLLPTAMTLHDIFKDDLLLDGYRLTHNGRKGSNWYRMSDLYKL